VQTLPSACRVSDRCADVLGAFSGLERQYPCLGSRRIGLENHFNFGGLQLEAGTLISFLMPPSQPDSAELVHCPAVLGFEPLVNFGARGQSGLDFNRNM
jgi:hypothetical protein